MAFCKLSKVLLFLLGLVAFGTQSTRSDATVINPGEIAAQGYLGYDGSGPFNAVMLSLSFSDDLPFLDGTTVNMKVEAFDHTVQFDNTVIFGPPGSPITGFSTSFGWPLFPSPIFEYAYATITSVDGTFDIISFDAKFFYDAPPQVPLPAALPLFATVLAGGGLVAWRRKRKAAVARS